MIMKMTKALMISLTMSIWVTPALASNTIESYTSGGLGYVVISHQPVILLNHDYQGLSVAQRVNLVERRLQNILARGDFNPQELQIYRTRNLVGLSYRGRLLVVADPYTAYQQRITPEKLADIWRNNLLSVASQLDNAVTVVDCKTGMASWYGREFRGRRTASGERFDENQYTAAHRWLPFGTRIRVTNLMNNQSVIVVINDRGPWVKNRLLDLSWAAARSIGLTGVARVKMEILAE